ncbi:MAG: hypothetical protein Q7T11_05225 [Deltaproteobacteria bacterium]|nr:hypothetical protein [Deltaproteobacteria bacterium]
MRLNKTVFFLASLPLFQAPQAYACGACYEDNRAAVYSHEAAQKAEENPEKFEFVVVKVRGPLTPPDQKELKSWLSRRTGVDAATVAVSAMQQTIGFLFEKKFRREKLMVAFGESFPRHRFEILEYP